MEAFTVTLVRVLVIMPCHLCVDTNDVEFVLRRGKMDLSTTTSHDIIACTELEGFAEPTTTLFDVDSLSFSRNEFGM